MVSSANLALLINRAFNAIVFAVTMMDDDDNLSIGTTSTAASTTAGAEDILDLDVWYLRDLNEEKIKMPSGEEVNTVAQFFDGMAPHDNSDDNVDNDAGKLTEKTPVP